MNICTENHSSGKVHVLAHDLNKGGLPNSYKRWIDVYYAIKKFETDPEIPNSPYYTFRKNLDSINVIEHKFTKEFIMERVLEEEIILKS